MQQWTGRPVTENKSTFKLHSKNRFEVLRSKRWSKMLTYKELLILRNKAYSLRR